MKKFLITNIIGLVLAIVNTILAVIIVGPAKTMVSQVIIIILNVICMVWLAPRFYFDLFEKRHIDDPKWHLNKFIQKYKNYHFYVNDKHIKTEDLLNEYQLSTIEKINRFKYITIDSDKTIIFINKYLDERKIRKSVFKHRVITTIKEKEYAISLDSKFVSSDDFINDIETDKLDIETLSFYEPHDNVLFVETNNDKI